MAGDGRESVEYRYDTSFSVPPGFNPESPGTNPDYVEKTTYTYDDLGRQSDVDDYAYGDSTATQSTVYAYDPVTGNIASITTPEGTVNYVYDSATGLLTETWTGTTYADAVTDTLYGYTNQGQLASVTIAKQNGSAPNDLSSSNTEMYNADGDAIETGLPTTLYVYDADGNLVRQINPNGTETDWDYSNYWNTSGDSTETVTNKRGSTILSQFLYTFDSDRRKISDLETMTDPGEGATNTALYTWTYDALSRLTSEGYDYGDNNSPDSLTGHTADDYTDTYTYDLDGNRITKTYDIGSDAGIDGHTADQVVLYSYNSDNELTLEETDNYSSGVTDPVTTTSSLQYKNVYAYDASGSTTSVTTTDSSGTSVTTYTYDLRNRMIGVASGGVTTTYTYDTDNQLATQQTGTGTVTEYLWDRHNPTGYAQVIEIWQGGSTPAQSFTIGNTVTSQNVAGVISVIMPDGEGSTRQLTEYTSSTSTNGHVVARYDYDAFGDSITFTASTHASNSATTEILYKNELTDPITGNPIMGAREYVQSLGRFSTEDGIRLSPGDLDNVNLYVFVANNPENAADPTGHLLFADTLIGAGAEAVAQANQIIISTVALGEAGQIFSELEMEDVAADQLATDILEGSTWRYRPQRKMRRLLTPKSEHLQRRVNRRLAKNSKVRFKET